MRIDRFREDGGPVRRFFLTAEVTFADREAEPRDQYDHNYYQDSELKSVVTEWMSDALSDRDDSPAVRFREDGEPVRIAWEFIIESNNSGGIDAGDLAIRLERAGFPCPDDLDDQ